MRSPWLALAALCLGFFLMLLDSTITAVAIPDISAELGETAAAAVWVNSGYLFAYAVPLLFAGRLGDRFGARRVYVIGLAVFTLASLACGLSGGLPELTASRIVQGFGAALMTPQTLTIIRRVFPARTLPVALGVWGSVGGVAVVAGPLLGGVLVTGFGWPAIFLVNVPLGVIALVLAFAWVPASPGIPARIPVVTSVASAAGVFALVYAVHDSQTHGVLWTVVLLVVAVLLVVLAFAVQPRDPRHALVPGWMFTSRTFVMATIAATGASFVVGSALVPVMLWLQEERGLSVGAATLVVLPMGIASAVVAPLAGLCVSRWGSRPTAILGTLLLAASTLVFAFTVQAEADTAWIAVAMAAFGVANSFIWPPLATAAMTAVTVEFAGAASGTYNATRQVGAVLGSALVAAAIAASGTAASLWMLGAGGCVALAAALCLPARPAAPLSGTPPVSVAAPPAP